MKEEITDLKETKKYTELGSANEVAADGLKEYSSLEGVAVHGLVISQWWCC